VGNGAVGTVFKGLNIDKGQTIAIKSVRFQKVDLIKFEMDIHKYMGTYVGSEPVFSKTVNPFIPPLKLIHMKFIDGREMEVEFKDPDSPFDKYDLYQQAKLLLKKLHEKHFVHGDPHMGNFMVERATGKVWMFDYDNAYYQACLEGKLDDIEILTRFVLEELNERNPEKKRKIVTAAEYDRYNAMKNG
jgi:tRNA A-37 threonylcarbamoyl transferase component Bud32